MREELSPAIDAYLRFRGSQDYSKRTLRVDQMVLKRFLAVNGNLWTHAIDEKHVNRHFEEASRTRSASSLQNDHGVLIRFFKWARHTGRMPVDSDPMFGRRRARPVKRERERIPAHEFDRLLEVADREPRNRAMVAVLLYTLMRDGEVTDLRIRDLDLQGGWLTARIHKTRLEDRMPISEELDREMRRWLTHYTTLVGPLQPHYFLIPARAASPVLDPTTGRIGYHRSIYQPEKNVRTSSRILKPILEGIDFPVVDHNGKAAGEGAHTIRRSGARALFDQLVEGGYDHALRIVQSMLHHSSMAMTEKYIGITADRRSRDEILRGRRMYNSNVAGVVKIARG